MIQVARLLRFLTSVAGTQFLRFCVVGAVGFMVDAGVLLALTGFGVLNAVTARFLSFSFAVIATFELNRRWVFSRPDPTSYFRKLFSYVAVQSLGFLVNFFVYVILVTNALAPLNKPIICLAIASGIALFVNYAGAKLLVFKRKTTLTPDQSLR